MRSLTTVLLAVAVALTFAAAPASAEVDPKTDCGEPFATAFCPEDCNGELGCCFFLYVLGQRTGMSLCTV
jgi:hypothetical protein